MGDDNTPHQQASKLQRESLETEWLAVEYERIRLAVGAAANDRTFDPYSGQCALYVDRSTGTVIDTDAGVFDLLGYARDDLVGMSIHDLEMPEPSRPEQALIESLPEGRTYDCFYRQRQGRLLPVQVYCRLLEEKPDGLLRYHLSDMSLSARLRREFQRREDAGFSFLQKLKILNEITIELSRSDSFDALCRQAVALATERLGFDRLGLWLVDRERQVMTGTYGIDEFGQIRDEHEQSWPLEYSNVMDFLDGKTEAAIARDYAPIYNERSEIIADGWHIAAPVLHGDRCIGVLAADNFLRGQNMRSYQPELLRLYGITIGHLSELIHAREQDFTRRLDQERFHMLRQFIADVGHDFRTPLSIINTKTFLMTRMQEPEQRQAVANVVQEQVGYISAMLDSALEFVSLERDLALNLAPIDLQTLLAGAIAFYRDVGTSSQLRWELTYDPSLVVSVDAAYMGRALARILENAVQYTPAGGWVRISSECYAHEIGIRIADSGIGIEPAALDKIFKPLFRANVARTEPRSGLGLPVARTIVEAHGGRIAVESTPGIGSAFEIFLPRP